MNFRKGILALAVAGLGLTGVASAQVNCNGGLASASVPTIRAEGMTEMLPALTVSGCSLSGANTTQISIAVSTSAGVSNQATSSSTQNTDATATFFGDATAVPGVVQGNQLVFTYTIPGTLPSGTTIVINNVRVNASSQAVGTNVTAAVNSIGGITLTGSSPFTNVVAAFTQHAVGAPLVGGFANQALCNATAGNVIPLVEAQISNGFFGAFTPTTGGKDYISVTFNNLVSGVSYYVPNSLTGTGGLTLDLVASNSTTTKVTGTTIGPSSGTQVTSVAGLTATNGSATVLYYVTGATAGANQTFVVPVYAVITTATTGTSTPVSVTAQMQGPATGYDQFAAPNPAPTAVAAVKNSGLTNITSIGTSGAPLADLGELTSCTTTLLFPYVLNTAGYDTGIAITNASVNATTGVAQSGTCSLQFFGNSVPSTNPYVTPSVSAGGISAFTVSSVAAGFQGYALATCNFQDAHGFAFITDGYGQAGRGLSQGYLAIVTAANGTATPNLAF